MKHSASLDIVEVGQARTSRDDEGKRMKMNVCLFDRRLRTN